MSTIAEIEAAIEKLSPEDQRELAAWYEQRQALLNAANSLFQVYEDGEKAL
jgi:cytochrome c553